MEHNPKIKLPTPVNVKIHKKLDLFAEEKLVKQWNGSGLLSNLFYIYLFNKYKNNCAIASSRAHIGLAIYIDEPQWKDLVYESFNVFRCIYKNKSETFVIPLRLVFPDGSGHSNLLIYRKKNNVIEHFEPHGLNYNTQPNPISEMINFRLDQLIDYINIYATKTSIPPVTLVRAAELCPWNFGLQAIEEMSSIQKLVQEGKGYCAVWSMFFTELVLKNPTVSSRELMDIIFDKMREGLIHQGIFPPNYLRRIAIGYVHVIHEKIEKYYSFISGIKKITVDEIIDIMSVGNKNRNEVNNLNNDYINLVTIHNFLLNNPSVTKEEYIAELEKIDETDPHYHLHERLILFLNRINTSLLNPSITKSSSQSSKKSNTDNPDKSRKSKRNRNRSRRGKNIK